MAEFPSLSWLDADRQQAELGLLDLVVEVIEDMESYGEVVPSPMGKRYYLLLLGGATLVVLFGAVMENLIVTETAKHYYHQGETPELFFTATIARWRSIYSISRVPLVRSK